MEANSDTINKAREVYFNEIYTEMILSDTSARARNILKRHYPTYLSLLELEDHPSEIEDIKSCGEKTREEIFRFLSEFKERISILSSSVELKQALACRIIKQRYPFLSENDILFVNAFKESEKRLPALYITIRFLETTEDRDLRIWGAAWGIVNEAQRVIGNSLSKERIRQIVQKVNNDISHIVLSVVTKEEWEGYGLNFFFSFSNIKLQEIFEKEKIPNKYLAFYLLSAGTQSDLFIFSREGEQLHINTIRDKSRYQLYSDSIKDETPVCSQKKLRPYLFACNKVFSGFYLVFYIFRVFEAVNGKFDFDICSPINNCIERDTYWKSKSAKSNIVNSSHERAELYRALKAIAIEIGGKDMVDNGNLCCKAKKVDYARFVYETLMEEGEKLGISQLYTQFLNLYPEEQMSRGSFSAKIRELVNENIVAIPEYKVVDFLTEEIPHTDLVDGLEGAPIFEVVKIRSTTGMSYYLYALRGWNDPIVEYISNYVGSGTGSYVELVEHLYSSHLSVYTSNDIIYYTAVCYQRGIFDIDIESVFSRKWESLCFYNLRYGNGDTSKEELVMQDTETIDNAKSDESDTRLNINISCPACKSDDIVLWNSSKQTYRCRNCNCYFNKEGLVKGPRCPVCNSPDTWLWNSLKQTFRCKECNSFLNEYGLVLDYF